MPKRRYRFDIQKYEEVRELLGHGALRMQSPTPHKGDLNLFECETDNDETAMELKRLGGEVVE